MIKKIVLAFSLAFIFGNAFSAEQNIPVDTDGGNGGYPFIPENCGGTYLYLYQDYDLSAISSACALRHDAKWRWNDTSKGIGVLRARIVGWDATAGEPDPTDVLSQWSNEIDVTTIAGNDVSVAVHTSTWATSVNVSNKKIAVQYQWNDAAECGGNTFLEVHRDNGDGTSDFQMWRELTTGINTTGVAGRTFNDSVFYYDDSVSVCTAGAKYITFTGDPLYVGDEILKQLDGTTQSNLSNIKWNWFENSSLNAIPNQVSFGTSASTDANGRLNQIIINTPSAAGTKGFLDLELGTNLQKYEMTIQE